MTSTANIVPATATSKTAEAKKLRAAAAAAARLIVVQKEDAQQAEQAAPAAPASSLVTEIGRSERFSLETFADVKGKEIEIEIDSEYEALSGKQGAQIGLKTLVGFLVNRSKMTIDRESAVDAVLSKKGVAGKTIVRIWDNEAKALADATKARSSAGGGRSTEARFQIKTDWRGEVTLEGAISSYCCGPNSATAAVKAAAKKFRADGYKTTGNENSGYAVLSGGEQVGFVCVVDIATGEQAGLQHQATRDLNRSPLQNAAAALRCAKTTMTAAYEAFVANPCELLQTSATDAMSAFLAADAKHNEIAALPNADQPQRQKRANAKTETESAAETEAQQTAPPTTPAASEAVATTSAPAPRRGRRAAAPAPVAA